MFATSRWSVEGNSLWYSYNTSVGLNFFQNEKLKNILSFMKLAITDDGSLKMSLYGKTKSTQLYVVSPK